MDIALVAAAGWKAAGIRAEAEAGCPDFLLPLHLCPEPLLPIGSGETVISRLSRQLSALGLDVHIGVGQPGCLFPKTAKLITNFVPQAVEISVESPWDTIKVAYAAQFGKIHIIEEPDERTGWDSICLILDDLEAIQTPWTRALMVLGDSIFPPGCLEYIVSNKFPCWYVSRCHERLFWLGRAGVEIWRDYIWRIRTRETNTKEQFSDLREALSAAGANLHEIENEISWYDIDHWQAYEMTLARLKKEVKRCAF